MSASTLTLPRYLTTAQAAEMLAVAQDKIGDFIHSGQLPAVDVSVHRGGRARWRIALADLEAFIALRRTLPPSKPTPRRKAGYVQRYYQ